MATTIQSGRASSPLLTADVASRAEVYGGRGLVFDGVTDYLTLGNSSIFNHSGNYSISVWIKKIGQPDSNVDTNANPTIIAKGNVYFTLFVNHDGMLGTFFYNNSSANDYNVKTADGVISLNVWHHVVLTWNNTSSQLYVDGKQEYSGSYTPYNLNTGVNEKEIRIGDRETPSSDTRWHGNMCDMKIFNSHITEAQVTELYLKPENTPSAIKDSIVAWYPMCESNPESPQSIVYDHSEKKLGSELITASLDTGSGITSSSYITYDGKMNINASGQDFYITINNTADTSSTSFRYRLVVTVDSYTSGGMSMAGGSAGFDAFTIGDSFNDIIVPDSNGGSFQLRVVNYVGVISSISLKKIEMGNHATTKFFGDELVDTNARTFEGTSTYGWAVYGSNTIANDSNTLKITRVDNNQGAYLYLRNATDLSTDLTVGKTYLLKADFLTTDASKTFTTRISNTGGTDIAYNSLNNTSFVTKEFEFVAGHATNAFLVVEGMATDGIVKVDNLSLKEVGISSTGFTTAQNEPVIPQIPLVRYNEKMLFDGVDNKLNPSAPNLLVSSDWSISAWFIANSLSADQWIIAQTVNASNRIGICINTSGNVTANMWDGSNYYTKSSTAISVGTMNHVVFTNSNKTVNLYLNGVLQSGSTNKGLSSSTGTFIGCKTSSSSFFNGVIDDVSFFNHTITTTQAQELFADGIALDATTHSKSGNLLAYYRNDGVTTWKNRADNFASFDGVNDIITRNAINVDYKSISLWVRPSNTFTPSSSAKPLLGFGNWAYNNTTLGFATSSFTGELITLTDNDGSTKQTAWIPTGGETIPNDSWTHIAFVWDGSKYIIYYNGQPQTVIANSTGHYPLSTNKNIRIATGGVSSTSFFDGDIANVAFWSESLTDAQMLSVYNSGHNGNIASIQSSDLKLYYTFNPYALTDADTNASVQDRSGNNNDSTSVSGAVIDRTGTVAGTPDSITIREGLNSNKDGLGFPLTNPTGNVLRLNGVNEITIIPKTSGLDMSGGKTFTMSCWFKASAVGVNHVLISSGDADTAHHENSFYISSSNKLAWNNQDSDADFANSSGETLAINTWYFATLTFNGSTTVKIYLNDALDGTRSDCTNVAITHTDVYIGKRSNGLFFNGLIDEARIYNRELSLAEIQKNYKHQKGKHK